MITLQRISQILMENDGFEILTHRYPDGDTLGSAFSLCLALQQMGKKAKVTLEDALPSNFSYITKGVNKEVFTPKYVISVDVAAWSLLGQNEELYKGKINLCIDHHGSNNMGIENSYIEPESASASEIIYCLLKIMNIEMTKEIANCLYTGVSTDTGCFRYTNTTARTHMIAADLFALGCDFGNINRLMFETKSRAKLKLERMVYDTIQYCAEGKCAIIYTTLEMQRTLNLGDDEMEGLASIPRQIEGVLIGITMKEKPDGTFRISARTNGDIDACAFCAQYGGGGHKAAAGCSIKGDLETVKNEMISGVEKFLS